MSNSSYPKVGVFIDVSNVYMNGGQKMRYDVLRHYAQAYGTIQRLNAYLTFDVERAQTDREYNDRATGYQEVIRSLGFHTTIQEVRWYYDPETNRKYGKADADVLLTVDLITQAQNLDHIILVSGDGDFVRPIEYVRTLGCRVEVIGFENVSQGLRKEADAYTSGYMIPELLPTNRRDRPWGSVGSTVRGMCYYHQPDESFGFLTYLEKISPLAWISDPRHPDSPYKAVFFHDSNLPEGISPRQLPSRWIIFEFEVLSSDRGPYAGDLRGVGVRAEQAAERAAQYALRDREPNNGY